MLSSVLADEKAAGLNVLTEAEKAEGWSLLFDGKDLSQWKNYQKDGVDPKWQVADGAFTLTEKGGGDILTKEQYGSFELKLDYNISKGGNSGLMFHVLETEKTPWMTGPEILRASPAREDAAPQDHLREPRELA